MKKTVLLIAALLVASPKVMAIEEPLPDKELSFEYSMITGPDIAMFWAGVFVSVFSLGHYTLNDISCTGQFSFQYCHSLGERWMVGCSTSYEHAGFTMEDKNGVVDPDRTGGHFFSIMPTAKCYWFNKPHFGMYSEAQVGALASIMPDTNGENLDKADFGAVIGFQLNLIGMDFGGPDVRGFLELGVGTQGFISLGIKKSL